MSDELDKLFEKFLKDKTYLQNVSPRTLRFYRQSYNAFKRNGGSLDEDGLMNFMVGMTHERIANTTKNIYIRGMNSFTSWLYQNGHIEKPFRIQLLKASPKPLSVFTDDHISRILKHTPTDFMDWRMWTSICLMIDTGIRVDELLKLYVEDIDLDNMIIKILGKGRKYRLVPMSMEMRRILVRYLKKKNSLNFDGVLFPTMSGRTMGYRNYYRDMKIFCEKRGISGVRISPHTFRHYFAIQYLRRGGDLFMLSKTLGHHSIVVTQEYLKNMGMDVIKEKHEELSPLSRLINWLKR